MDEAKSILSRVDQKTARLSQVVFYKEQKEGDE